MKKTLLAAALLAGFAGAAHAQSSVTLYGVIDVGLGYNRIEASSAIPGGFVLGFPVIFQTPIASGATSSNFGMRSGVQSGSRWGLRGSEDLGNGLRAVFQLESGFNSLDGNPGQGGRLFGRHATLGLAGDSWGQIDFGRQTNMASKYFGDIDPLGTAYGDGNLGHGISSANTRRLDNLVLYRTPDFAGFQAGIGYSFDTGNNAGLGAFPTSEKSRSWTVGVRYANGPLNVAASFDQVRAPNGSGINKKPTVYAIGASYDFNVAKVAASFARTTDGWLDGQAMTSPALLANHYLTEHYIPNTSSFRANSYMLGVSAPIGGSSKVFGSWQRISPSSIALTGDNKNVNTYSAGVTYDFSKRTNLYAHVSYATNFYFIDGLKSTSTAVGLRHRF